MKTELYLGLDVHKETITVAVAEAGRKGEIRHWGTIANSLQALEKLMGRRLQRNKVITAIARGLCAFV